MFRIKREGSKIQAQEFTVIGAKELEIIETCIKNGTTGLDSPSPPPLSPSGGEGRVRGAMFH